MTAKRYTFVLNFGYAESGHMGYMPWTSRRTYKDAKDALVDLATFLKEQFVSDENEPPTKKCCVANHEKEPEAQYCSKCGRDIGATEFDGEEFVDWCRQLDTDIDTFAGMVECDREARWQAGLLEGSPNQRFVYNAELVLAAAVGHVHHDKHDWEAICKARTKSKKDAFTYW